ncbi:pentapeptide repeat-containing protein [Halarcobacter sp.]|uniref:pentapeptide repeat-containing protein n=1 Tax=Halarcobacter sp. TaxID=2321133 RepID=UPI003A936CF4
MSDELKCECTDCSRETTSYERSLTNSNKCIFHCEKDKWDKSSNIDFEKIEYFWKEVREYIRYIDSNKPEANYLKCPSQKAKKKKIYIFDKFIFPASEDDSGNFENLYEDKNFFTKNYGYIFSKELKFNECEFLDVVNFINVRFESDVEFENCIFKKEVQFNGIYSEGNFKIITSVVNYGKEDYFIQKIDFPGAVFKDNVKLKRLILNKSDFDNCIFEKESDFYKTEFKLTSFKRTRFCGNCIFDKTIIYDTFDTYNLEKQNKKSEDKIKFNFTKFEGITTFYKTVFIKKLDLINTYFYDKVNFLDISSNKYIYKKVNVKNRETARIIKNSFEQQNNIIEANKFYALEMKEMENELEFINRPFEWLVFKIHGLASNHSQDWFLASLWVILFGMLLTVCKTDIGTGVNIFFCIVPFLYKYLKKYMFIVFYSLYFLFMNSINKHPLDDFASNINPFSIMTSADKLNFTELVFKIIIAFLIYQLIVSIRQNTRRK